MSDNEENVLDAEQWKKEAQAIINDIKWHLREISISTKLKNDNSCIYLNLTTFEGLQYCIEVSTEGFSVVGVEYDEVAPRQDAPKFETPYSLLDSLSPHYKHSFTNELTRKLVELSKKTDAE